MEGRIPLANKTQTKESSNATQDAFIAECHIVNPRNSDQGLAVHPNGLRKICNLIKERQMNKMVVLLRYHCHFQLVHGVTLTVKMPPKAVVL